MTAASDEASALPNGQAAVVPSAGCDTASVPRQLENCEFWTALVRSHLSIDAFNGKSRLKDDCHVG